MRVTRKSRLRIHLENVLFVVLFVAAIGLLAWLSTRYNLQADWTAGGRNTLSAASQELLDRLQGPISITAYARDDDVLRSRIRELVERYRRHKGDIDLRFVDPDSVPDKVRELGITVDGELLITYRGRSEHLQSHTEQAMTNALQRVARAGERRLVFITGHGERQPLGQANHDLGDWGRQLEQRGFRLESLNLAERGAIPEETAVVVVAGPQVNLLPGEVHIIQGYVERGGNLLWLADPGSLRGLGPLAEQLGIEFQPGVIVDPTTRIFGIDNPAMALVTGYPFHPLTRDFDRLTVYPQAVGILADPPPPWESRPFLTTSGHAWSETGELAGEVRFDEKTDISGPLDIGVALTRDLAAREPSSDEARRRTQRIAVVGDGDFLSNAFLGTGGNLDMGLSLANWLASDDALIAVPAKVAPDLSLALTKTQAAVIAVGWWIGAPLLLLGTGLFIWMRRRRR
jgi:ABC-type uncharacterized transport system involved in gliding motility auxiliary subunit